MHKKLVALATIVLLLVNFVAAFPAAASPPQQPPLPGPYDTIDIGPRLRRSELPIKGKPPFVAPLRAAGYGVGDKRLFLALDDYSGYYFFTWYTVKAISDHCEVWIQDDLMYYNLDGTPNYGHPDYPDAITDAQIDYLINEFNNTIYATDLTYFGTPDSHDGSKSLLAKWGYVPEGYYEGDGDKIVILISNIRDERFYDPTFPYYIAGFYSPSFETYGDRNFITIDCKDWEFRLGPPGTDWTAGPVTRPYLYEEVTVHEFQHLIHDDYDPDEDSWVNEGCSEFSEYLAGYKTEETHGRTQFQDWPENSLIVWGDQPGEILADYQMVYLWTMYLFQTQGGAATLKALVHEPANGILGVNKVLAPRGVTFADVFYNFKHDMLYGGYTDTTAWGATVSPPLYLGRLRENLSFQGYDTPGAPQWGSDYIKIGYHPALGKVFFDGTDGAVIPSPWTVTSELPFPPSGNVAGSVLYSGHQDFDDRFLIVPVDVPAANPTLEFETFWNIEDNWDYAFVQVSTDGAATWTSLSNTDTITETDPHAHGIIKDNVPGFTGFSGGWRKEVFDLSPYAGQSILLAFRYAADWAAAGSVGEYPPGWWIDNVKVGDAYIFTETMPAGAMSIFDARGATDIDFRVTFLTFQEGVDAWTSLNEMTLDDASETGVFDLGSLITSPSQYAVMVVTYEAVTMDDLVGGGVLPYQTYRVVGLPPTLLTSALEREGLAVDPDSAYVGGTVTYRIVLDNIGDAEATGSVVNPIPEHTTYVPGSATGGAYYDSTTNSIKWSGMVPGKSKYEISFQVTVNPDTPVGTVFTDVATIYDGYNTLVRKADTTVVASPIALSMAPDKAEVYPGERFAFHVTVRNDSFVIQKVRVSIPIPDEVSYISSFGGALPTIPPGVVTWTGALLPGQSFSFGFVARVKPSVAPGTVIATKATVADRITGEVKNVVTASTTVVPRP